MRYELMFPYQIRESLKQNWPVVFPIGVLEYHSEHLSVGVDGLIVERVIQLVENEVKNVVVMPTFWYGASSYAVAPPEGSGSLQIEADSLLVFAKDFFRSLIRVGYRNIHCFIFHQTENFDNGMPTDLAFRLGARQVLFEYLEENEGEGWWGEAKMADYYKEHEKRIDPFSWIQVHPLFDERLKSVYSPDHAGKGETSLMMSLCPDGVDMTRFTDQKWYARTAKDAAPELAEPVIALAVEKVKQDLGVVVKT